MDGPSWLPDSGDGRNVSALIKSLYAIPVWTRVVRLVAEHHELQRVLGCAPSLDACYRFTRKLREFPEALSTCIEFVIAGLAEAHPQLGEQLAIDGNPGQLRNSNMAQGSRRSDVILADGGVASDRGARAIVVGERSTTDRTRPDVLDSCSDESARGGRHRTRTDGICDLAKLGQVDGPCALKSPGATCLPAVVSAA